ncbi:MAG TPA: alpha/beta hydrolase [Ktedonobacterales bacterium]
MPFWNRRQQPEDQRTAPETTVAPFSPEVVRFHSADGVPIACYRSGSGPALVAVHGTGADHAAWDSVTPLLARHFTVYVMDRRGRGGSGDTPEYSMEREITDVVAVVDGIGQPVHLYGHSSGAMFAVEAAMRTPHLASLVLYEGGPKPPGFIIVPDEFISQLEALIEQGKREEAMNLVMPRAAGVTPQELDLMRRTPAWAARVAAAHTIPRELRAINAYGADLNRFGTLSLPTLLLVGERTDARRREMFLALNGVIQGSRMRELAGQGHAAHQTAPELLAAAITEFLSAVAI